MLSLYEMKYKNLRVKNLRDNKTEKPHKYSYGYDGELGDSSSVSRRL